MTGARTVHGVQYLSIKTPHHIVGTFTVSGGDRISNVEIAPMADVGTFFQHRREFKVKNQVDFHLTP